MEEQTGDGAPRQFAALRRPAWIPQTEPGDGAPTDSKFAGTPYLGESGEWPPCRDCRRPIQLFLQLNLDELPEAARGEFGSGLLQFFHCTYYDTSCDQFYDTTPHFSNGIILRLMPVAGGARTQGGASRAAEAAAAGPQAAPAPEPASRWKKMLVGLLTQVGAVARPDPGTVPLPPRRIVGWREVYEYPEYWEAAELLGYEPEEFELELDAAGPQGGDKLGGWPSWVQDIDYPDCPTCGRRMRHVFQLASQDNLPYIFGDMGTGHVTQCPEHKEVMGFHWAST